MNKIIKNIKLNWKWFGDIYMLRGFNIALMNEDGNPSTNDLSNTLAYTTIQSPKQIIENQKSNDSSVEFTYTFSNQMFDENIKVVPWIQALYDNNDSAWASLDGAIIEDDGNATIVVVGNPTFQQIIDMATDSKITPQEKLSLEKEWDEITAEHYMVLLGAVKANLPTTHPDLMDYDNKIDILASYLNNNQDYTFHPIDHIDYTYPSMITDGLTTDLNTGHYGGYEKYKKVFNDYYQAKVTLLETIRQAIIDNNNEMIQDTIDKNTLPDTIPVGGYCNPEFEINKNISSNKALGFIRIKTGHFITTTGQKHKIEKPSEIVTNLNSNKTRIKYILFIGADKTRFSFLNEDSSKDFISAMHKNNKWYYFCGANDDMLEFEPIPEDCVVGKIEEHSSISGGTGIRAIKFTATTQQSVFDQLTDGGEQQFIGKDENGLLFINGEYIQAHTIKGGHIVANGLKAVSTDDGRTTFEITENGEARLDVKNFTLRAGGEINMQGVVNFESLAPDMQGNFVQTGNRTTINGDSIRTGKIAANNNVSEYNLDKGTFRLGGTGEDDYKLYFDGVNLKFGDGAIQWPDAPMPDMPELEDFMNHAISLSKDTMTIKLDRNGIPEIDEVGINGKATSVITVHRGYESLTGVNEDVTTLESNEFKYIITKTVNCVAKRKSNNEIYIDTIENSSALLDTDVIGQDGYVKSSIVEGGYVEIDVICGNAKQKFKKIISFTTVQSGKDGIDGTNGNDGQAAKYIKITGEQIFKYDTAGLPDIEQIQLKATTYNFYATKIVWEYYDGLNWVKAIGVNNQLVYTITHDSSVFGKNQHVRLRCIIDDHYLDEITISRLYDGLDGMDGVDGQDGLDGLGYTVVLSNEAHTIACDEFGTPLSGEVGVQGLAKTDITAYKNTTKLTPIRIVGGDYSSMQEGEYCIDIIEQVGCKAKHVDADTIYIEEMISNSGYISINVICEGNSIAIKRMSLTKTIKGQDGQNGQDGSSVYIVVLTNDYHSIPTDPNGNNGNFTGCETSLIAYYGENIINDVVISAQASSGVAGRLQGNKYIVDNMSVDSGYVDMTATIDGKDFTKRFTIAKNKSGEHGTAYWLITSASTVHKTNNGSLSPNAITFSAKMQQGENPIEDFACKFRISTSTDGSSFSKAYESTNPETSYTYTINSTASYIRCQMLKFDDDTILDEERIPVLADGKKGDTGATGPQGPAGPQGPQGPQGPPGTSDNVPDWVEEWNSNSTTINGQSMLSPRIFAGFTEADGTKTGIALGRQALSDNSGHKGLGLGVWSRSNLIARFNGDPELHNNIALEIGVGSNKLTVDKYGNVTVPKMTASEIVSTINGGSTTINGSKISTGTITATQIQTGTITADQIAGRTITAAEIKSGTITAKEIAANAIKVDMIDSASSDPILKLFYNSNGYCSIDATRQYETGGKGSFIRLKWNRKNYWFVGENKAGVYLNNDSDDINGEYKTAFWVSTTHARFAVNKIMIGTGNCRIDTDYGAMRLYTTPDNGHDRGIRIAQDAGRLDVNNDGAYFSFINSSGTVTSTVKLGAASAAVFG